jgi:hypothetical protein
VGHDFHHCHTLVVVVVVVLVVVAVALIFDFERFVGVFLRSEHRMIRWDSPFELVHEFDHESLPKLTLPFPRPWIESAFVDHTNPIQRATIRESDGFYFVVAVATLVEAVWLDETLVVRPERIPEGRTWNFQYERLHPSRSRRFPSHDRLGCCPWGRMVEPLELDLLATRVTTLDREQALQETVVVEDDDKTALKRTGKGRMKMAVAMESARHFCRCLRLVLGVVIVLAAAGKEGHSCPRGHPCHFPRRVGRRQQPQCPCLSPPLPLVHHHRP